MEVKERGSGRVGVQDSENVFGRGTTGRGGAGAEERAGRRAGHGRRRDVGGGIGEARSKKRGRAWRAKGGGYRAVGGIKTVGASLCLPTLLGTGAPWRNLFRHVRNN